MEYTLQYGCDLGFFNVRGELIGNVDTIIIMLPTNIVVIFLLLKGIIWLDLLSMYFSLI